MQHLSESTEFRPRPDGRGRMIFLRAVHSTLCPQILGVSTHAALLLRKAGAARVRSLDVRYDPSCGTPFDVLDRA